MLIGGLLGLMSKRAWKMLVRRAEEVDGSQEMEKVKVWRVKDGLGSGQRETAMKRWKDGTPS